MKEKTKKNEYEKEYEKNEQKQREEEPEQKTAYGGKHYGYYNSGRRRYERRKAIHRRR